MKNEKLELEVTEEINVPATDGQALKAMGELIAFFDENEIEYFGINIDNGGGQVFISSRNKLQLSTVADVINKKHPYESFYFKGFIKGDVRIDNVLITILF